MNEKNRISEDLPDRRRILKMGATGALAILGMSAKTLEAGSQGTTIVTTPAETEGPYWIDELLKRQDIRVDPSTGLTQAGLPLYLTVSVTDISSGTAKPLVGAYVDLWHANAYGVYSDEPANNNSTAQSTSGQKWLRGYQVTNSRGITQFITVYPGWYVSRTVHIHARVRTFDSSGNVVYNNTTQFFFDDSITNQVYSSIAPYTTRNNRDTVNSADSVYNSHNSGSSTVADGNYLMLRLAEDSTHAVASFNIVFNTSVTPTGGGGAPTGGGGGTGGGPGGGGPGGPPPGG